MSDNRFSVRHIAMLPIACAGLLLVLTFTKSAIAGLPHMTLDDRPLLDALTSIRHKTYGLTGRSIYDDVKFVQSMNEDCQVLGPVDLAALRKVVKRQYMSIDGNGMFDLGCYLPHLNNHALICVFTKENGYVVSLEEIYDTGTGRDSYSRYVIQDEDLGSRLIQLYTKTVSNSRIRAGKIEFETVGPASSSDSFLYTEAMELQRKHK